MFFQLFVLQIGLSNRAPDRFFSRATFCAPHHASDCFFCATFSPPNHAPEGCFRVPLFVLQIVFRMGLFTRNFFARNFSCFKLCSRWFFRVQLLVLQIVLQMLLFACNFFCSELCSGWVFLHAFFFGVQEL